MEFKDRVGRVISPDDFVLYVTAGDRHPVLEFGWVLKFHESSSRYTHHVSYKIKLQRADADGTRHNTEVMDVPGHWREDAPERIKTMRNYYPTSEERNEFYVPTTYRDTGKPSTTMLDLSENSNNHRLMVIEPII